MTDTMPGQAEADAAQAAYRAHVRAASMAIVFGLAAVLAVTAVLPTTHPVDRAGLLFTAGLVIIAGVGWFALVSRRAFAAHRILVAASVAQGVMTILLALTGGVPSVFFAYYLLPVLVMILSGSVRDTLVLGGLSAVAIVGLTLSDPAYGDTLRDLAVTRLFELGTVAFFAAATARATGETRRVLAARTETLAGERHAALRMAVTDQLTGLYNRHYMNDELRRMTAHATRHDGSFAVISLDVDDLKVVNDSGGHQAGDDLLRAIADALRAVLRIEDVPVRVGGDEFVVLVPDADRAAAMSVVHRIKQRTAALGERGAAPFSAGIAVWRRGTDPEVTLNEADEELYRAKAARREPAVQPRA